jgi:hypothetical protein
VSQKRRFLQDPHGVTPQKTPFLNSQAPKIFPALQLTNFQPSKRQTRTVSCDGTVCVPRRTVCVLYCVSTTVLRLRPILDTVCDLKLLYRIVLEIRVEIIATCSRVPYSNPYILDLSWPGITNSTPLLHPQFLPFLATSHMT